MRSTESFAWSMPESTVVMKPVMTWSMCAMLDSCPVGWGGVNASRGGVVCVMKEVDR